MTTEEKAKAYDELFVKASRIYIKENDVLIMHTIEDLFPELKESEDERIRKELIEHCRNTRCVTEEGAERIAKWIIWLEKQGEHTNKVEPNFKAGDKIQFLRECGTIMTIEKIENGEYIFGNNMGRTTIESGNKWHLVNLVEQKPAGTPKFKVGDFLVNDYCMGRVVELTDDAYLLDTEQGIPFSCEHNAHLWTIQDVKDGDFLVCGKDKLPFIFKGFLDRFHPDCPVAYCGICEDGIFSVSSGDGWWTDEEVFPANKKQREQLEKAITDAGFMWDAKQKKLKKIDEEVNGEDYGIDSLWHAQNILEKTLGSVDGYQSDDGILEHKCAISVVKKLYKQKPTDEEMKELLQTEYEKGKADAIAEMQKSWSEKDEKQLNDIMWIIEAYRKNGFNETHIQIADNSENWLKSLKDRIHPHKQWKPSDEQMDALNDVISSRDIKYDVMSKLWEDLNKLREV